MTQIKLRRDTAANFTSKNPVLGIGEPAYETDTKKLKIGDGTTAYTQLEYFSTGGGSVDSYTKSETNALLSEKNDNIFDIGKFTVVGNPTITDDGIASGFSSGNYLKTNTISITNANWEVTIPLDTTNLENGNVGVFDIPNIGFIYIDINKSNQTSPIFIVQEWSENGTVNQHIVIGKKYTIKWGMNNGKHYSKIKADDSQVWSVVEKDYNVVRTTNSQFNIGFESHNHLTCTNGQIDLKHFSITANGKEVFNGLMSSTKPIYDAIKANNTELSEFKTETSNDFSAVNSALNEKANLTDLALKQNKLTAGDNVTLTNLTDGTVRIDATGSSGLEVCDIGMALYVDETKGLRRYLNGQVIDRNTNTEAFFTRLQEITTLHPSLLCTEDEWQTAKTMSAFGQVGKFVFNYSGNEIVSVRLPRVVNVQGLFDLQNLGMTVKAGLPNMQGRLTQPLSYNETTPNYEGALYSSGKSSTQTLLSGSGTFWTSCADYSLDASRSNPIYGNSDTVQPEAIQYPYFIQIATGSETENNIINEIELNNPYSLFDSKHSDHELNNLSWLKSEGQWNSKAVYPDAYDELLREYNNPDRLATFNKDVFEVVGNPTITSDGIASGFVKGSYVRVFSDFYLKDNWEVRVAFSFSSTGTGALFANPASHANMLYIDARRISLQFISTGASTATILNSNKRLEPNTKYFARFKYNSTTGYTIDISTNGIDWENHITLANTSKMVTNPYNPNAWELGVLSGSYTIFKDGSIDLKQFSITVDGVKVFSGAKSKVKLSTETYTDYDFVLNTAEETFRLPLKNHTADDGNSVLTLYYYVGETVQNANLIDAGRIGEQLANKIGRTECKAYITETYVNGTSWYRVYSDGWIEQGGHVSREFKQYSAFTITFLKAFSNANNYLVLQGGSSALASVTLVGFELTTRTTTSYTVKFNAQSGGPYTLEYDWYVCGY